MRLWYDGLMLERSAKAFRGWTASPKRGKFFTFATTTSQQVVPASKLAAVGFVALYEWENPNTGNQLTLWVHKTPGPNFKGELPTSLGAAIVAEHCCGLMVGQQSVYTANYPHIQLQVASAADADEFYVSLEHRGLVLGVMDA